MLFMFILSPDDGGSQSGTQAKKICLDDIIRICVNNILIECKKQAILNNIVLDNYRWYKSRRCYMYNKAWLPSNPEDSVDCAEIPLCIEQDYARYKFGVEFVSDYNFSYAEVEKFFFDFLSELGLNKDDFWYEIEGNKVFFDIYN